MYTLAKEGSIITVHALAKRRKIKKVGKREWRLLKQLHEYLHRAVTAGRQHVVRVGEKNGVVDK